MYNMDKDKLSRRHHKNPSFSSTLLDEIYRSIDGYEQRREDLKLPKLETRKPKANTNINKKKSIEDEEIASFRRACLIEKWMENKVKDKVVMNRRVPSHHELENDPLIFSSTSSESNSGTLSASSSEPDYSFYSDKSSTTTTCFAAPTTKSMIRRASVSPRRPTQLYSFDNQQPLKNEENNLIKSKSRALKMYHNLKKVKQPISPGGRLTTFLTSIFNNKSKNPNGGNRADFHQVDDRNSKSSSICSSLSRSCLSKTPPKFTQNGIKRTVRFNPVSVIVDEDCRPCGHKSIYDQDSDDLRRHKSQGNAEKNRKFEVDSLKSHKIVDYTEEEDDAASSCSSSDLFEIDHLALFGDKRFCEELPVYETTHVDTNRGIATGFIR